MATYQGSQFEAGIGPAQGDIVLFAACPPPEDLGFEPATGHWRKQLRVEDVQSVWESRPVGLFRGERCMVLDDLGDRLHIGYLGHDGLKAEHLGYWQVDRGVFELVAPRSEVTDILEERTEHFRQAAAQHPVTGALPASPPDARPSERRSDPAGPSSTGTSRQEPIPGSYSPGSTGQHAIPVAYMAVADDSTGVALPVASPAPLPLEAAAMRAASEARRARPAAAARQARLSASTRRSSARPRLATERLFAELTDAAGIPAESYSVGEAIDGAMCLVQTDQGYEVFHSVAGGRQELQLFATEEAAFFYLFGVLAAEAVRSGTLARIPADLGADQSPIA